MDKKISVEIKEGYLVFTEYGKRTNLLAIVEDAKKASEAVKMHKVRYVLADFRKVINDVPFTDAFNLVKIFENKLPLLKELIVAYVANRANLEIVRYWESICHQRGYQFKVFTDYDEAEKWLIDRIEEQSSPNY